MDDRSFLERTSLPGEPFVHVCDGDIVERTGDVTLVRVYSNQPEVDLYKDGQFFETKTGSGVFEFYVPIEGEHSIEAAAGGRKSVILVRRAMNAKTF